MVIGRRVEGLGFANKPDGGQMDKDDSGKGNPGALPENLWIDMVQLGERCAGDCLSCGAFENVNSEDRRVRTISLQQLEANLSQEIVSERDGTRVRLVELLRRYVTAGVDMEPLDTGIFNEAADLIFRLSNGRSKLVAISHGLTCSEKMPRGKFQYEIPTSQLKRLQVLCRLMLDDVVPLFVLSMDSARRKGLPGPTAARWHDMLTGMEKPSTKFMKFVKSEAELDQQRAGVNKFGETSSEWEARMMKVKRRLIDSVTKKNNAGVDLNESEREVARYIAAWNKRRDSIVEANARGYAKTLHILMPAIKAGKRVTISLQGDENDESLAYHGLARRILQRTADFLGQEHNISNLEINRLFEAVNLRPPRLYAGVGRAKNVLGVESGIRPCPVIPDPEFIDRCVYEDPYRVTRGRIRADGTLEVQAYRASRTYNDTVDPSKDNPWVAVDLTREEVAAAVSVAISVGDTTIEKKAAEKTVEGDPKKV